MEVKKEKNIVVAYLLWWFVGFLGLHRLYANMNKWWAYPVALLISVSTFWILIGYIFLIILFGFWVMDGFRLINAIKKTNGEKNESK